MSDLRSRKRALASQTIVDACADLVTARHHLNFSMKEVAERSGVSLRTVYNHFATREDLLDALGRDFNGRMSAKGGPDAGDLKTRKDLLDAVRTSARLFEEMGGISEAFAQMPLADVGIDLDRADRTKAIAGFIAGLMPDAPPEDARAIGLVLRHLLSHRSWFWLTREYGLTTEQVGDVVVWAIDTLIDAAASGDLPGSKEDP